MSGRDQQHQAVNLAPFNALELLGDLIVQDRRLITRIGELGEAN
jgi:hypothetical protein